MRKFVNLLLAAFLLFSCTKDEKGQAEEPIFELSSKQDYYDFVSEGGSLKVGINTNYSPDLTLESSTDWASAVWLDDEKQIEITALKNDDSPIRSAKITVKSDNTTLLLLNIRQLGDSSMILLSHEAIGFDYREQDLEIIVTTNCEFEVECDADWISFLDKKSLRDETLVIHTQRLPDKESRHAIVKFKAKGSDLEVTLPVNQSVTGEENVFINDLSNCLNINTKIYPIKIFNLVLVLFEHSHKIVIIQAIYKRKNFVILFLCI